MTTQGILAELEARGTVQDVTAREELSALLDRETVHFYIGFDPTGTSLHAGSLVHLGLTIARIAQLGGGLRQATEPATNVGGLPRRRGRTWRGRAGAEGQREAQGEQDGGEGATGVCGAHVVSFRFLGYTLSSRGVFCKGAPRRS